MRKKLTLTLTILILAVSMSVGALFASAQSAKTAVTDLNWTKRDGEGFATVVDDATLISGLNGWEHRLSYDYKVKLDGLQLDIVMKGFPVDGLMGFAFAKNNTDYFGSNSSFTMKLHSSPYGLPDDSFARLYFGKNHDHGGGVNFAQMSKESDATGFKVDGSDTKEICFNKKDGAFEYTYSVKFEKDGADFYKVTVTCANMYGGMGGKVDNSLAFFIKTSNIQNALDANGDLYIIIGGFSLAADSTTKIKITDANGAAYNTVTKPAIEQKITEYGVALGAVTDSTTANAALAARNSAIEQINTKAYKNDVAAFNAKIALEDAKLTNDQFFKKLATDVLDDATTAISAFSQESNITDENITVAKAKVSAAATQYNQVKALLKTDSVSEIDAIFASNLLKLNNAEVVKWIMLYEGKITALDVNASTIGADIALVKTFKKSFSASAEKALLDAMPQENKDVLNARILAADNNLALVEAAATDKVKDAYLVEFEATVAADLKVEQNIRLAIASKNTLEQNVTITDTDGELFTRFTSAKATLTSAIDSYLLSEIAAVKQAAGKEYNVFGEFDNAVTKRYNKIDLTIIDESSAKKAEILAAYEDAKAAVAANFWSEFNGAELTTFVRNKDGVNFEMTPKFPAHFNYNKKLNVESGIDIKINLNNISYFNGDKDAEGNPLGANNLSINFLTEADRYKSTGSGFNIIIWLFEVESNVTLVDAKDAVVQSMSLATPLKGGELQIKFNYKDYYDLVNDETYKAYIIDINGNEMVLKPELLEARGINLPTNDCYFSIGSFADKPEYGKNNLTLTQVNDVKFALKDDGAGDKPGDGTGDGDKPVITPPKGCGCSASSVASLFAILPILFGAGLLIAKRR